MVLQVDKDWFVTTPAVALLTDGQVISAWEAKAPDFDKIIESITVADYGRQDDRPNSLGPNG